MRHLLRVQNLGASMFQAPFPPVLRPSVKPIAFCKATPPVSSWRDLQWLVVVGA